MTTPYPWLWVYGAIAYSPSTGRIGWDWRRGSWNEAAQNALFQCGVGAEIVISGGGYMALALGSGGAWGTGRGTDPKKAKQEALANCSRYGTGARIALVLHGLHGAYELDETASAVPTTVASQFNPTEAHEAFLQRNGWGALSCSSGSRLYSYAINESSAASAELAAVQNCRQPDAVAVISGFNTHLALARCRGGFGAGQSQDAQEAEQAALRSCLRHGHDPQILLILHTLSGVIKTA